MSTASDSTTLPLTGLQTSQNGDSACVQRIVARAAAGIRTSPLQ
jgi:hypothetical protein